MGKKHDEDSSSDDNEDYNNPADAAVEISDDEESGERKQAASPKKKSSKAGAAAAASSKASPGKKKASYLSTEQDEEDDWNTARNEAAEAAALQAQLSGDKAATKRRRITKLADVEDSKKSSSYRTMEDDDDGVGDFVEDDLGEGFAGDDDFGVRKDKKLLASIGVQEAFQPGSTPKGGTGEARFLCYNVIGSITSVEEQTAASIEGADANTNTDKIHIVQLNYTDQTKHKASKFRDFFGFIVAAVGPHGTVFGSPRGWDSKEKKELPSTIFFRPSDSWDRKATSEWTLHLDLAAKEEAVLVAVGDTWVAVATNKQYVRIISHTGIQLFILSVPGPVVSMVGQSNQLALVFHDGVPLPGHQNLGLIVMDCVKHKEIYRGKCVISPRSILTWIGFSDVGLLLCMDSYGVIRALGRSWDWQWTPVLDTALLARRPGSSALDVYWPVSVMDDKLMCLVLTDGKRYPTAGKRSSQNLQSIALQLPFLGMHQPIAQTEEMHARHSLLWYNDLEGGHATASRWYTSKQEVEQDKLILTLFQRAAKHDFLVRALDLSTMFFKRKSLELAIQMAEYEKKESLVGRLRMLLEVKFPKGALRAATDEDGVAGFVEMNDGAASSSSSSAAAAAGSSRKGKLQRPAVSFEEAAAANARGDSDDEGEAEYLPAASSLKSSLKRKSDDHTPASTPSFSSGSLAIRPGQKVQSANVTGKAKPASSSQAATQGSTQQSPKKNPFANK